MTEQETVETIRRLEGERGRALLAADWDTLERLIAEDLVHIHANGAIEDRSSYFAGLRNKLEFLRFERETLEVRGHGNLAVATGILKQTLRDKESNSLFELRLATTQVWSRCAIGWRQMSFQATHIR
jgi:ketosteroid isomerase-like protein